MFIFTLLKIRGQNNTSQVPCLQMLGHLVQSNDVPFLGWSNLLAPFWLFELPLIKKFF